MPAFTFIVRIYARRSNGTRFETHALARDEDHAARIAFVVLATSARGAHDYTVDAVGYGKIGSC